MSRTYHHIGILRAQVPVKSNFVLTINSLYCHLLCGLVLRDEVTRVCANFASILVQGITFLEIFWKEMCSNIRSGQLSDWITDSCRGSVSIILGGLNPQLADIIEDMQPEIMERYHSTTLAQNQVYRIHFYRTNVSKYSIIGVLCQ